MTTTDAPRGRLIAAGALAVEGAAGIAAGVGFALGAWIGHPSDRSDTLVLAVLLLLCGTGIAAVARGVWRERGWARTPAYLIQFFVLVAAWNLRERPAL